MVLAFRRKVLVDLRFDDLLARKSGGVGLLEGLGMTQLAVGNVKVGFVLTLLLSALEICLQEFQVSTLEIEASLPQAALHRARVEAGDEVTGGNLPFGGNPRQAA